MIGKLIGAWAGAKVAERTRGGTSGPGGALMGAAAVAMARRLGPVGMIAAAAGGYALKRYSEKRQPNVRASQPNVRASQLNVGASQPNVGAPR